MNTAMYNFFVRRNEHIRREYERYVQEHVNEHYENRWKHWKILGQLNWHYRIQKKRTPMLKFSESGIQTIQGTGEEHGAESNDTVSLLKNFQSSLSQPVPVKSAVTTTSNGGPAQKNTFREIPESQLLNRPQFQHFANRLSGYDVVSFDIFDTLIFRPFDQPTDLFMLLESENHILDFARIRIEAEREVRRKNSVVNGNRECTLEDIYEIIEQRTGLNAKDGIHKEVDAEIKMCRANPYMKHVFDILSAKGHRIILVSDMYLSQETIVRMLTKCGYRCECIEKIFISTEYSVSKSNGKIYKTVKKYLSDGETVVHVGDHLEVDVKKAREYGFTAFHYPQCASFSRKSRPSGMSVLIGSAYRGVVATHIYNGVRKYSAAYEHGFIYGGILALGFAGWIHRWAKLKNLDKLLFVSRDGKIYMNVFNALYDDIETFYIYWSRIAHLNTCAEFSKDLYLQRFIRDKVKSGEMTVGQLLDTLGLENFRKRCSRYRIKSGQLLSEENVRLIERMISEHWEEVLARCEPMKKFEIDYFKSVIGSSQRIGIVDVGWTGYGELDLKKFLLKYISRTLDVSIFMIGITEYSQTSSQKEILGHEMMPYAFSCSYNTDLFEKHITINRRTNNIYVELLSQDTMPSFIGMKNKEITFDIPEVENYPAIRRMHEGTMDFVRLYAEWFKDYPFMFEISGRDAMTPLIYSYENVAYYKNRFPDFCFSRTVQSDVSRQSIETLADIMRKNNL